jgi:hypothetical protein
MWFGLSHPSIVGIPQCVCTQLVDPMGIHFLHCVHDNKHTKIHEVIHNTFVTIARDAGFHMGQKQLHAFPSITFNSFCWQVDIVFTKDDIHILVDIFIVDSTWSYLRSQSCTTQGFATSDVAQVKENNYCNQHLINEIFPVTIEIFDYLHKHGDAFLHNSTNVIWSLKGPEGLHLFTLVTFVCQKISITLQKMQASSILS